MTDYFAANDLAALIVTSGTPTEITSAGHFDASYCSKAISGGTAKSPQFINPSTGAATSLTDGWVHFDLWQSNSAGTVITLYSSGGIAVIRMTYVTNNQLRMDYWNGSAWITTGTTFTITTSTLITCDVHFVCGVSGSISLYVGGSLATTVSGLNAAVTNVAFVETGVGGGANYSQILISDTNTVGAKVGSRTPNANGADTNWTGSYSSVVKTGFDDTSFISSGTTGDKESFTAPSLTIPSGYTISSVWFAARGKLGSTSPVNVKPLLRIGGVDYAGTYNFGALSSAAFGPSIAAFTQDPSTSAAWGTTNANAAELGFQSAA